MFENIEETEVTKKMTVDGITKIYPVYKVRIDQLYYNDQNDRIATWISRYKADNNISNFNNLNREKYNDIIGNFIKQSNVKAFNNTLNNISAIGQQEPAVILPDGRIIDGNRRFTCLKELSKENSKFNHLEAVIIEKDIQNNKKEIKLLELYLQHGREERVDYNPIDKLVGVYNDIEKNKLLTVDEYARNTGLSKPEVNKLLVRARLMEEFLELIDMPEHFYIAREWELDGPLAEIDTILKKVKSTEEKEELKNIIFTHLLMKPNTDMTRYVRNIKRLVDTPQFKEFIEEGKNQMEDVLEKFEETDHASVEFINNNVRSDESLKEEMSNTYDKYQERVKKRNTLNAPKNQIEKAIEAINNIDPNIVIQLDDENHEMFLNKLNDLKETISDFEKEVYGDAKH
ncbi:ParB/RepB/Spo0J family partition protein [Staphylococcus pettenkoferi]|uniref:ParB/RepB/Spo0J family partition protein n=1 Tax=Staphylococcus pettenkoferi TaxID=170573 RepID=UPI002273413E|nr:ParB/RepB/Spo0J family partition protein [Staphylococcus pettenkoferi]MCY1573111.1 ParB/RepB/Spo0J family partition protein [Staphylococcus pettenkoferi]MCY1579273.1 ParB/RepB/Spo0J family partition protein [Staphylococcus pettenkoferi]